MFPLLLFTCLLATVKSQQENFCEVFKDDFEDFDLKTWKHDITLAGGGNWEFQHYTNSRENSFVKDGILYIYPTLTNDTYGEFDHDGFELNLDTADPVNTCTNRANYGCSRKNMFNQRIIVNPVQSALIRTIDSVNFKYGKVEISARLPKGDWLWPAIWMMPKYNTYGSWPASGEIDIVESRGNAPFEGDSGLNNEHVGSVLHWGNSNQYNRYYKTLGNMNITNLKNNNGGGFHNYTMTWTPTHFEVLIDQISTLKVNFTQNGDFYKFGEFEKHNLKNLYNQTKKDKQAAPFNQEFYLIINVAVGGTNGYFPDKMRNKPWKNSDSDAPLKFWEKRDLWLPTWEDNLSRAFAIDYVKISELCC